MAGDREKSCSYYQGVRLNRRHGRPFCAKYTLSLSLSLSRSLGLRKERKEKLQT